MIESKSGDSRPDANTMVKNDYMLKAELTIRVFICIFSIWLIYYSYANLLFAQDSLVRYRGRVGIILGLIGVLSVFFYHYSLLKRLLHEPLEIRMNDENIEYEYVANNGAVYCYLMEKENIKLVQWSILPIFGEMSITKLKYETLNDKLESFLSWLLQPLFNIAFVIIFFILSLFKFQKYYIVSDGKIILAIPARQKNNFLEEKKTTFSFLTLRMNLILKTSNIFKK